MELEMQRMNPERRWLRSERGSAMVFTLMVLVILTVVGIAASNRSSTELNVVTSQLQYHRNFNLAEGAAMEAFDLLEGIPNPGSNPPNWLETVIRSLDDDSFASYLAREPIPVGQTACPGVSPCPRAATLDPGATAYIVSDDGVVSGHSLDMSKSTLHMYGIYGHSESEGSTTIKIGYRKAF
jgi:hypothetical protein